MTHAMPSLQDYIRFLEAKASVATEAGFIVDDADLQTHLLKPHQQVMVKWALRKGRGLIAASFGLGKTRVQCEMLRLMHERTGQKMLVICPLGVRQQFTKMDGPIMGLDFCYVGCDEDVLNADTPYLITNYERVRDGQISAETIRAEIGGVTMDEAAILGNLGTKTLEQFRVIFQDVPYRWAATATPAPNDYRQMIYFADFFDVMDAGQALTRWFGRNPDKAGDLRLHPHMEREFWLWVASWALFVNKPSDLGYSDDGYVMPELEIVWHRLTSDHEKAWELTDNVGQHYLLKDTAAGVQQATREKRDSMDIRIAEAMRIIAEDDPAAHWVIWHHLEDERHALRKALPDAKDVYGSQDLEERERRIVDFSEGKYRILATKPQLAGSGTNFQFFCNRAIYSGLDFKFRDFIQSVHRLQRYGQTQTVVIHMIHTDAEDHVVQTLMDKWRRYDELIARMRSIVHEFGLTSEALVSGLQRTLGVHRQEWRGDESWLINNDTVAESFNLADESLDMILTSIPFGNHYEYVAKLNDFGHNPDDDAFWQQMDYLIPHLYRALRPGRIAAIHVKDRLMFAHQNEWHTPIIYPFSDDCNRAFMRHGFIPYGRITVATDVVRENASTYRLGYTEMCKDGSAKSVGMPEYVLLFRKPQTNATKLYSDVPVRRGKDSYSRMEWQIDAHSFWRSDGDRQLTPEELIALNPEKLLGMDTGAIYRWWREFSRTHAYNHPAHIEAGEILENGGKDRLPAHFGLMLPQAPESHEDYIWTDILFMRTLNMEQARRRVEKHVCPLPLDIVRRCINRFTNPGELVYDPFAGIGTVPYVAVDMGRRGAGVELNPDYFDFAVRYLTAIEQEHRAPTLFDLTAFAANGNSHSSDAVDAYELEIAA